MAALVGAPAFSGSVAADTWPLRSAYAASAVRQPYTASTPRWRPVGQFQRMARPLQGQRVIVGVRGFVPRNARPVSGVRDLVAQFRPDPRFGASPATPQQPAFDPGVDDLNAQFRPLQPRRQLTYEQLQQQQVQQQQQLQQQQVPAQIVMPYQVYPVMPYMVPPPPPVPYWAPRW